MSALPWYGVKHGPWETMFWGSVIPLFLLCTRGHSIPTGRAACWRTWLEPLQPGSCLITPDWTWGWCKMHTSFHFYCVFTRQSQGSCWDICPWKAAGQCPPKERGRVLQKGNRHSAPARPAPCASGVRPSIATTQPVMANCHRRHPLNYTCKGNLHGQ